jgi:PHD/YefM family antitoxin component YafN of YafNO toxin-antitoxin module
MALTSTKFSTKFKPIYCNDCPMTTIANIKSISYLKSHAAQIAEDVAQSGSPYFITQNGEASMVIESMAQFQEKEALLAALRVMALGEKERVQGTALTAAESRTQLATARQGRA